MSEPMPPVPELPIKYATTQEPYRSNTELCWHMAEADALRARLRAAAALLETFMYHEHRVDQPDDEARALLAQLRAEKLIGGES